MTTFSFSTGNPSNLTGGATASMTDISGSLTDLKTFLNGGSITDTNISAGGLTDTSLASPTNAVWRPIMSTGSEIFSGQAAGTYWAQNSSTTVPSGSGSSGFTPVLFFPSAADIAVSGKTARLRVVVGYATNATAPGITMTFGVYPISILSGGLGTLVYTLGTVIAGSTVAVTTPTLDTVGRVASSTFDYSAVTGATAFTAGVVLSGTVATNAMLHFTYELQMRHT